MLTKNLDGGVNRKDFWSTRPVSRKRGTPFKFTDIMLSSKFEKIQSSLVFTDQDAPTYKDRFWEVRQILKAFNDNMKEVFMSGWMTCLYESMSI